MHSDTARRAAAWRRTFVAAVAAGCLLLAAGAEAGARKVILDTDPGTDDALAILLALNSPELDVEALTIVPGNVQSDQGLSNATLLLGLAARCDVPAARGAVHPLNQRLVTAAYWHGKNGLADLVLTNPPCKADLRFGPDLIIELVHKFPHQITLIALGPLTNIALAVSKDPTIVGLVADIVIMGGSLAGGNVTGAAEFNISSDPEAAQIVFNAGWVVTMIGSDVGSRTVLTRAQLARLAANPGRQSGAVESIATYILDKSESAGAAGMAMYDPLAVASVVDPALVTLKPMRIDVETRGEFTRGETVANRMGTNEVHVLQGDHYEVSGFEAVTANAKVCVDADAERFVELLVSRLKGK